MRRARSGPPPPADLLQKHRENDEDANEGALPIGIDSLHQQRIADHLEERRADEGAIGAALAAHQIGAADDGRGDDAELVAGAERVDRRRSEEHTSELSHLVISYAVFCLKKK